MGSKTTIRDAYFAWRAKLLLLSSRCLLVANWKNLVFGRRIMSDAVAAWSSVLDVSVGNDLSDLFRCSTCEYQDSDGNWRVRALGLDGTATCLLNRVLPQAESATQIPALATKQAAEHFLLRGMFMREGLQGLLMETRSVVASCHASSGIAHKVPSEIDVDNDLADSRYIDVSKALSTRLGGRNSRRIKRGKAILELLQEAFGICNTPETGQTEDEVDFDSTLHDSSGMYKLDDNVARKSAQRELSQDSQNEEDHCMRAVAGALRSIFRIQTQVTTLGIDCQMGRHEKRSTTGSSGTKYDNS
jgi:hypothetical protein